MKQYDFLIVGAGISGLTAAQQLNARGRSVLLIDKEDHLGGNSSTEYIEDIEVHIHGPHVFHTHLEIIWNYVNSFTLWCPTKSVIMAKAGDGELWPFPINLATFHKLNKRIVTPDDARRYLSAQLVQPARKDGSFRDVIVDQIGGELYGLFYQHYTQKQWGISGDDLPASIAYRVPIRMTYNTTRFDEKYEGYPVAGWGDFFKTMIYGVDTELEVDYLNNRKEFDSRAGQIIYTGSIDALFDFDEGRLPYRTLHMDTKILPGDFQGCMVISDCTPVVPWTRVTEHKFFRHMYPSQHTVISYELPRQAGPGDALYYPIPLEANKVLASRYQARAQEAGYLLLGRLGTYQYIDMDKAVYNALKLVEELTK